MIYDLDRRLYVQSPQAVSVQDRMAGFAKKPSFGWGAIETALLDDKGQSLYSPA